ncbi:MAG: ABC transporter permease [Deltaproteobacteria bacterium]|nr:ABC transporter permease [Deltaproteobacteria bacterium]
MGRAARTLLSAIVTLWAIATGTFLLMEHAPGGPESGERRLPPEVEAANLVRLGLADAVTGPCAEGPGECTRVERRPMLRRYVAMLGAIATFDLGFTYTSRGERTVRENLSEGLPVSAAVGGLALLFALLAGVPLGLYAASRGGGRADRLLAALATAGVSVPAIVLGPLLLYLFAIRLRLFPVGGLDSPASLVLPSATLGLILASVLQRMTRAGAAGFLEGPVAKALAARGLPRARLLGVHALRHAAIPMLGYLPPAVAALLTGSVVIETVFDLPGIARHLIGAAVNRDHPMVMGVVLAYSTLLVALTTASELLLPVVDPRLRGPARTGDEG